MESCGFNFWWCHWIFHWPNPSSCTMVLVSTQPLTEMRPGIFLGVSLGWLVCKADNLFAICEPIVSKCGSLDIWQRPVTGIALPFLTLGSIRWITQNVFGIVASWVHVRHTALGTSLDNTESLKKGVCALHNFYARNVQYIQHPLTSNDVCDEPNSGTSELFTLLQRTWQNNSEEGKCVCKLFLDYFKNNWILQKGKCFHRNIV
jgi:hypothetical protein